MLTDNRDLLEVLKCELEFVQRGGYQTGSWRPLFVFEDSPSCPNAKLPARLTPCANCVLIALVPPERREEEAPCRYIPLTEGGETIDSLYRTGTQQELEEALEGWLRKTIRRMDTKAVGIAASGH